MKNHFIEKLSKNAEKGLRTECKIERATGINRIKFPMKVKLYHIKI